jgi:hypothetical protein
MLTLPHLRRRETGLQLAAVPGIPENEAVLNEVDRQIRWYDSNARRTMQLHFRLRTVQIVLAATIPITQIPSSAIGWRLAAGVFGAVIAVCQGFDAMHHYSDHYVAWRATCQQLLRERQLFAAGAGAYQGMEPSSSEALRQLATRATEIEAQEQQKWAADQMKALAPVRK